MAELDFLVGLAGEKIKRELLAQVNDSISEETQAIDAYRRRADYCRRGYPQIAKLYDHIREEEDHHRQELVDMASRIRKFETKKPEGHGRSEHRAKR